MVKNFYDVLAVQQNATQAQLRGRFRELVRSRHPDRFQGAEKEQAEFDFQEITQAFNILNSPASRRAHDLEISQPAAAQQNDPGQLARVYIQRGSKSYKERNFSQAADNFDRACQAQPTNARCWHHLALAASQDRKWRSRAPKAIVRACELEPMNADYLKLAGRILESTGKIERAEHYFNEALKWGGGDPEVEERLRILRKASGKGRGGFFG